MNYQRLNNTGLKQQRGIATILIVLLVGLAMTASSLAIMHSLRATQQKQVAVHAITHAQTGVWAGAEAFRRYLGTLTSTQLKTLNGSMNLQLGNGTDFGAMSLQNITSVESANSFQVKATIVNAHGNARASAAVEVVYEVNKGETCPGCVVLAAALNFYDDLDARGNLQFLTPAGQTPIINVDGDIVFTNVSVPAHANINATGSITLDSGISFKDVHANGNVHLKMSATADKVTALGEVSTEASSQSGAKIIWANGNVTLRSSYRSDSVNSRSTISVTGGGGSHGLLKAKTAINLTSTNTIDKAHAQGNIQINSGTQRVDEIIGQTNLTCNAGFRFKTISVNGTTSAGCQTAINHSDNITSTTNTGANNTVTVMEELKPFVMPPLTVDVWVLKQQANYVFEWDSSILRPKITINNVNGINNGAVYWLGNYVHNQAKKSYLCTAFNGSGECTAPQPSSALPLCIGNSNYDECLKYTSTTKTWTIISKRIVPGILWFDGNIEFTQTSGSMFYSTILATGNVTTGGSIQVQAANYAGFDIICKATTPSDLYSYKSMVGTRYPKNLCDTTAGVYKPLDIGNIAIAAGGYNPAGNGSYSGGTINLGSSNVMYGIVLAGNYLKTGGSTTVYGHVTAANLGVNGLEDNMLGGSTTVDLTHSNTNYTSNRVPDMTDGSACPDCGSSASGTPGETKLLWSKYL